MKKVKAFNEATGQWEMVAQAKDGTTFIPSVDENGNLSWTNEDNKPNPSTINIKGEKGDNGENYVLTEEDIQEISSIVLNNIVNAEEVDY